MAKRKKEKAIKSTCMACGKGFWATEDYVRAVQAGHAESVCPLCEEPIFMEDDNASDELERENEEPEPENR